MKDDEKKSNQLTHAKIKILDAGSVIFDKPATTKDSAFMARELVQCTLPYKNPGDVPEWVRRNGNLTFSIKPGYKNDQKDQNRRICIGYPYGSIPRLLLFWMITEAIRTKSRRLELGNSLRWFMAELGLNSSNGSSGAKRSGFFVRGSALKKTILVKTVVARLGLICRLPQGANFGGAIKIQSKRLSGEAG
jgi:hypothetical protein